MIRRIAFALSLGLGLALGLLWLLGGQNSVVLADLGILYVAPDGDCGGATPCYATVQAAVDAASAGDDIRVAAGTYHGVSARAGVTQTVYISKTVTIQGGYTTANWTAPNPVVNPTTLDAQGQGRVLFITGAIRPMVKGLRITGGDATGLGGDPWGRDGGGGVYVYETAATISDCVVYSNTASTADSGSGGGLFLRYSPATLSGNTVVSNTASTADWGSGGGLCLRGGDAMLSSNTVQGNTASTADQGFGGGLCLRFSPATLIGNTVQGNTASTASYGSGGGLFLRYSPATLSGNTVQGNAASRAYYGYGGGLHLDGSDATLSGNTVQGNTASTASGGSGGGLYLGDSDATLSGNTVVSNAASTASWGYGGGLYLYCSDTALINNVVAGNQANTQGSGLYLKGSSTDPTWGRLLHTTIASNGSTGLVLSSALSLSKGKAEGPVLSRAEGLTAGRDSGQGVFADEYTTLAFTNTIIAGHHSVGIMITTGSTATLEATLWYNNGSDTGGEGAIVTGTVNVTGDPAFANPSVWDYHLTAGSAAIDKGVDAGVTTDIDGDVRPQGGGYDIGADEWGTLIYLHLPIVLKDHATP